MAVQAESIQRQRFAHKRLKIKTPKGEWEAKYAETALKHEYDRLMKSISEISLNGELIHEKIEHSLLLTGDFCETALAVRMLRAITSICLKY